MALDWRTLGARTAAASPSRAAIDLGRLVGGRRLHPRAGLGPLHRPPVDRRRPAPRPTPRPRPPASRIPGRALRFLLIVERGLSAGDVRDAVTGLAAAGRPRAGSVAAAIDVRPIGEATRAGTRCFLVELAVPLATVLQELAFDEADLHALADALEAAPGVIHAEPDLPVESRVRPLQELLPGCTVGRDQAPADVAWAPRMVGFFDLPAGRPTGSGVRVGHIDTGFTQHPELDAAARFDLPACTTTLGSGGGDGTDPMPGGTSHGTATASLLTSAAGTPAINDLGFPSEGITGLAPGVRVVSVRAVQEVVVVELDVFFPSDVAEAVWHCIEEQCHVITMSIGGVLGEAAKEALREAHARHLVLCAAAGNCVGVVVEPASLGEVVACAAVGRDPLTGAPRPWSGTSRGSAVDISAPGENVWVADFVGGDARVRPGEGTSFAAPHVAGAAALWIDHHGRQALLNRYDAEGVRLGDVFRTVVRSSARIPPGWDTGRNGAGVLHLPSLLAAPLPPASAVVPAGAVSVVDQAVEQVLDLLTVDPAPVPVVVELSEVTCRDDGELLDAEPYLMALRILVDGTTAKIDATFTAAELADGGNPLRVTLSPADDGEPFVKVRGRGLHGSLDKVNIGPLELHTGGPVVLVPDAAVRKWEVDVEPIPLSLHLDLGAVTVDLEIVGIPGFVGMLAILAEEDNTTRAAVEAARDAVAAGIRDLLEDVLGEITLADLSVDPNAFPEQQQQIQDAATAAAAAEMNLWETFWGGVVDPDDQLFQVFTIANVAQLGDPVPIAGAYSGGDGNWTLTGEIRRDD